VISEIKHGNGGNGHPSLSKATEAQPKEVVQITEGYIYGSKLRAILPFVVRGSLGIIHHG